MICDCCDGSDEWGGYVTCPNTCKELYKQYYAERIKSQEEAMEGYKIRAGINIHMASDFSHLYNNNSNTK